ncbi:MAG: FHA domain-containing protein [Lachnospiraceae bacterium]|nr:FHA domain-containing protein [Lachnospiraceae bacterium]
MVKYIRKAWIGIAGLLLLCDITVRAAEKPAVVEHYTVGEEAILYVRGIEGEAEADSYQIGTASCEIGSLVSVKETEEGIKTLILWDNSLSVMNRCGDRVKAILTDVIANRIPGEMFALAVIDEEITYLSDYTDNYTVLKQIIEGVSGENQEAYIIDNLYQAIEGLNDMEDASYKRILLISDGMDATGIGYSKSELDTLISQTPYPVYTIGILDGKHQEELQKMFAFSRSTGVDYFYLNEIEDDLTIVQALSVDYSVLQMKAAIPAAIQDGSVQNSRLVLRVGGSEVTLQSQVSMPFATQKAPEETAAPEEREPDEQEPEKQEPEESPATAEPPVETEAPDNEKAPLEKGAGVFLAVWLIVAAVLILLIIVLVIVMAAKRRKKEPAGNDYTKLDSYLKNERRDNGAGTAVDRAGMPGTSAPAGGHKTQMLFDDQAPGTGARVRGLMLVNIKDTVQTYRCNITDRVIIGRNPSVSNLVIDDGAVSERHCEIELSDDKCWVKDLGSSNGTYVDGIRITAGAEVHSGTILRLGRHEYRLTIE